MDNKHNFYDWDFDWDIGDNAKGGAFRTSPIAPVPAALQNTSIFDITPLPSIGSTNIPDISNVVEEPVPFLGIPCLYGVKKGTRECRSKPGRKKGCKYGYSIRLKRCKKRPGRSKGSKNKSKRKSKRRSRRCKWGRKISGGCKKKPGPRRGSKYRRKKSKSRKRRSKRCPRGVRKDGKCKRKPGPKKGSKYKRGKSR